MKKTICYYSFFKNNISPFKKQFLIDSIKDASKMKNFKGTLIVNNNIIFQIIEGYAEIVDTYLEQIKENSCHHNLLEIINHPIENYSFSKFYFGKYLSDDMETLYDIQKYIDSFKNLIPENENLFFYIVENLLLETA